MLRPTKYKEDTDWVKWNMMNKKNKMTKEN